MISGISGSLVTFKPLKIDRSPRALQIPTLGKGNYADVKVFMLGSNLSLTLKDQLSQTFEIVSGGVEPLHFMRAEVPAVSGHR